VLGCEDITFSSFRRLYSECQTIIYTSGPYEANVPVDFRESFLLVAVPDSVGQRQIRSYLNHESILYSSKYPEV
jgi:hypothetical protein